MFFHGLVSIANAAPATHQRFCELTASCQVANRHGHVLLQLLLLLLKPPPCIAMLCHICCWFSSKQTMQSQKVSRSKKQLGNWNRNEHDKTSMITTVYFDQPFSWMHLISPNPFLPSSSHSSLLEGPQLGPRLSWPKQGGEGDPIQWGTLMPMGTRPSPISWANLLKSPYSRPPL